MKKQIVLKSFLIFTLTFLLLLVLRAAVELRSTQKLKLVETVIAARDIPPRTKITAQDLLIVEIPEAYLQDHAARRQEEVVGKYTEIAGMIPAGSPFYKRMLFDGKSLPDYPAMLLKEGQSAVSLSTDLNKAAGLVPGMYADLYAGLTQSDGTSLSGCLLEHVRILAVKDHQGLDLADENSTGIPYLLVIAVEKEDVPFISAVEMAGEIRLVSSSESYKSGLEAVRPENSPFQTWFAALDSNP